MKNALKGLLVTPTLSVVQPHDFRTMSMRYSIEVSHAGLGKHRIITGSDQSIVRSKANAQCAEWDARYAVLVRKNNLAKAKMDKATQAAEATETAQQLIAELKSLLVRALETDAAVDWESLKVPTKYPGRPPLPATMDQMPREPKRDDDIFQPKLGFWDKLSKSSAQEKIAKSDAAYQSSKKHWETRVQQITARNDERLRATELQIAEYKRAKDDFEADAAKKNAEVDEQKKRYWKGDAGAVHDYCDLVLSRSPYPDFFPKEWEIEWRSDVSTFVVDYALPDIAKMPTTQEVKYVKARDEFKEVAMASGRLNELYDDVVYQVCLRTIHELFGADTLSHLQAVAFNGFVTSIDRSTGQAVTACILSIHVKRDEFEKINLAQIDPKTCFRSLKGVGSSKLHSITPVAPVLKINHDDKRFIPTHEVANVLDASFNLAAMNWEEFEHLIREVFAAEFKSTGGEVKVTQASRDGGVDAVAFDPDPIRGGKIVIQAKRYTNTVGVSAVRDLYGTLMNEGANKGILVTTSDYGPDAYEFAKGKPLTLMNGGNLLFLLEKHGHRAKIDLREAKVILGQQPPPPV